MVNLTEDSGFGSVLVRGDTSGLITVSLDRSRNPREKWGFRLTGGKDRGAAFQLHQVLKKGEFCRFNVPQKQHWQE